MTQHSLLFKEELTPPGKASGQYSPTLSHPEISSEPFGFFVSWLYSDFTDFKLLRDSLAALAKCWLFAKGLGVPKLQNKTLEILIIKVESAPYSRPITTTKRFLEYCEAQNEPILREIAVKSLARSIHDKAFDRWIEDLGKGVLFEVLSEVKRLCPIHLLRMERWGWYFVEEYLER